MEISDSHVLHLAKWFWRYLNLNFEVPKNELFLDKALEEVAYLK